MQAPDFTGHISKRFDKDIEDLGTTLKVINIGLMPLLLTFATLFALWRRRQKELT